MVVTIVQYTVKKEEKKTVVHKNTGGKWIYEIANWKRFVSECDKQFQHIDDNKSTGRTRTRLIPGICEMISSKKQ